MNTITTIVVSILLFTTQLLWAQTAIINPTEALIKNTSPEYVSALGIDPNRLEDFGKWNTQNNWNGRSLTAKSCIVIKDGVIIGEWYSDIYGNPLPEEQASNQKTRIFEGSQTLAMLLFGTLANNKEKYDLPEDFSLSAKLYNSKWLPDNITISSSIKADITFDQVFSHSSGLMPESAGNERGDEKSRIAFTFGLDKKHPLSARLYFPPGKPESYHDGSPYSGLAFNHLPLVFKTLTGKPAWQLLENEILHPIGITDIGYSTELESTYKPWLTDSIRWIAAGGLWMRPVDYAKIGMLLANGGKWMERNIVPTNWISHFTNTGNYPDLIGNKPGYYWTNGHKKGTGYHQYREAYPDDMFCYGGEGLTWTYVIPSENIVVVRTSRIYGVDRNMIESQFLARLFNCFAKGNTMVVNHDRTVLPDPFNQSRLIHNTSGSKMLKPAFICSSGKISDILNTHTIQMNNNTSDVSTLKGESSLSMTDINPSLANITFYSDYPYIAIITPKIIIQDADKIHKYLVETWQKTAGRFSLLLNKDPAYIQLAKDGKTDEIRHRNWAAAMAGANIILPTGSSHIDSVDIARSNHRLQKFMEDTYFNYTSSKDELAFGGSKYILANQGSVYIIYSLEANQPLGIKSIPKGKYALKWFDCKTGKTLEGKLEIKKTDRYLWSIPDSMGKEVALYLVSDQFTKNHNLALTQIMRQKGGLQADLK